MVAHECICEQINSHDETGFPQGLFGPSRMLAIPSCDLGKGDAELLVSSCFVHVLPSCDPGGAADFSFR